MRIATRHPSVTVRGMPAFALVDAFCDPAPFTGNPAGVVLLDAPAETGWMQAVAAEMAQAETAFVHRAGAEWGLRWFTPLTEVDLCGHATLAAAHALWTEGRLAAEAPAVFATRSGALTCTRRAARIAMDFPAVPARACAPPVEDLADRLGARVLWTGAAGADLLVELDDAETVRALAPDLARLAELELRGVIVTAAGRDCDVVSRFFAPRCGIPEDHVTGSAHCALAPFWARRLRKEALVCRQFSLRGGTLAVTLRGERVELVGAARTVAVGRLAV